MKTRCVLGVVVCLFVTFGANLALGQSGVQDFDRQNVLSRLRLRSGESFTFRANEENGTVSFLQGKLSGQLGQEVERSARQVLEAHTALLGIQKPSEEFVLWGSSRDQLGMTHVRMSQQYNGVPVFGGEIVVHFNADGSARSLNGRYFPTPSLEVTPSLSSQQAVEKAKAQLATAPILRQPIISALNIYAEKQEAHLTWKVVIPAHHPLGNWTYFIDAHSGEVRHFFNDLQTDGSAVGSGPALDGSTKPVHSFLEGADYWLIDTSLPMYSGKYERDATAGALIGYDAFSVPTNDPGFDIALLRDPNNDNVWNDYPGLRSAVQAQSFLRQTLEFYRTEYGRNSWDNRGSTVNFVVHYSKDFNNAFYAGNGLLVFGDGDGLIFSDLSGSLDVIAHEFTHGVTDGSARLVYQNQSGALNESISDIFGAVIDNDDWLLGEDIYTPTVPGDALRSMEDPTRSGDPAHMNDYQLLSLSVDNGGVHTNSGIPNKAFYNIASVIGRKKAGQIFYRALTLYMTPLTQFVDARRYCLAAVDDLHGKTSPEYKAVQDGFDAVGIVDGPPSLTPVALSFGVAVNGLLSLQDYNLYYIDMPENTASLRLATTTTSFNVLNLYVSRERIPNPDEADYFAATTSSSETVNITTTNYPPLAGGRHYILVAAVNGGSYTITATNTDPQIVYVDSAATGANDGTSWANAFKTIQAGLTAATTGKWVWVANGTYNERITLKLGVALFGGFAGNETSLNQRNPLVNRTIIDGSNSGTVVNCEDDSRIDGFIIQNGNSFSGGGLNAFSDRVLISNNVIRNNSTSSRGGGLYASGTFDFAVIVGNVLYGNKETSTTANGAGMYFDNTGGYVSMNTIVNNTGDGIYRNAISFVPLIENLIIRGNTTQVDGFAFVGYSNIQGGLPGSFGVIDADPLFVNAAANDYRLTANSPCIDAGNPQQKDADGTRRDMGAFFFAQTHSGAEIALSANALNFGSVFVGENAMRVLAIENPGVADLNISSITTTSVAYTLSETNMTIRPGQSRNLFVTFKPAAATTSNATLTLVSNDASEGTLNVALNGSGSTLPPKIATTPNELSATVGLNGAASKFIIVENKGVSNLNYQVKVSSSSFSTETFGAQDNAFSGSSRMRGNIYHTDVATVLNKIEMFLNNFNSTTVIEFVVYQAETLPGPMVRAFSKPISNPGTGAKFYSSGDIAVPLQANKYYFIGAGWNNSLTYYLANSVPPFATSFGTLEYGSEENVYPAPLIYDPSDFFLHSPYYQRLTTGGSGWAAASASSGSIAPGASGSIRVDINAAGLAEGEYQAGVTIKSNDPHRAQQHIPLNLRVGGVPPAPTHFTFTENTGESYSIIIDAAVLGNPSMPLEFGDEIGVFAPPSAAGQPALCVGAAVWTETGALALTTWKDDDQTPVVDGFKPGQVMNFQIWDKSADAFYPAEATYTSGDGKFGTGIFARINPLKGRVVRTQSVIEPPRWSWISLAVKPDNLNAAAVISSLKNLVIMKNNAGQIYTPTPPPFNGIGNVNIHEGYAIYLSAADVWTVAGEDIADNEPLPVIAGWNFVAYYPEKEIDVATALASILTNLNIALADDGKFYVPGVVNSIGNLRPSEAYKVNMKAPGTLVYPVASALARVADQTPRVELQAPQFYQARQHSAGYHAVVIDNLALQSSTLNGDEEIGIFTADGFCVGAARVQLHAPTPIAVWQDNPDTPEHDGYRAGETLHYRLYRPYLRSEQDLLSNWRGDLTQSPFTRMTLAEPSLPTVYELSQNYPNPFNPETVIHFALPEKAKVKVQIFDALGRSVRVLLEAEKPAGFHEVTWNGRDADGRPVPSGIYFYKLEAGAFFAIRKMSLIK